MAPGKNGLSRQPRNFQNLFFLILYLIKFKIKKSKNRLRRYVMSRSKLYKWTFIYLFNE